MDQKEIARIESALRNARQLVAALEAMLPTDEEIHVPPEIAALVAERYANRICLACLRPFEPGERDKRGDHPGCYGTLMNRVKRGELTMKEVIERGLMLAQPRKPGRTAAVDQTTDPAETIAQQIADQIAPRKPAEPKTSSKKPKGSK